MINRPTFKGIAGTIALAAVSLTSAGCHHNKVTNPLAQVDSKQPDKVLFDRAEDAIKNGRYDVGRSLLTTMINTYPDSEFVARAKLAVADSWYAEGNTTAYAQAEREYKDFETFFPNMPEAAEAQMRIADIHYNEMGKPDRDYTQAKRAEDEYRQMLQAYPNHKLTPIAKQRLREVQEVLADGQFRVAHFYYTRESWPAAIARLKTLADAYPLYSSADYTLFLLGQAYENEAHIMENPKLRIRDKNRQAILHEFRRNAVDAYARLVERYPAGDYADAAGKRLQALEAPVPHPTPEAIARNKEEIASRGKATMKDHMMLNFSHHPDVATAAHVGDPTLDDPRQESAPALTQRANKILSGEAEAGSGNVSAEVIGNTEHSTTPAETPAATTPAPAAATPAAPASFESVPENPNASASSSSTTVPGSSSSSASGSSSSVSGAVVPSDSAPATPSSDAPKNAAPAAATPATASGSSDSHANASSPKASDSAKSDSQNNDESSSSKTRKKKKKLLVF